MFKPTVDSLIADITGKVAKLRAVGQQHTVEAQKQADAAAVAFARSQHEAEEAVRAERIAKNLETLFS